MQFEWDEKKAASNLHKHQIRFEQATKAFSERKANNHERRAYYSI